MSLIKRQGGKKMPSNNGRNRNNNDRTKPHKVQKGTKEQ